MRDDVRRLVQVLGNAQRAGEVIGRAEGNDAERYLRGDEAARCCVDGSVTPAQNHEIADFLLVDDEVRKT